MRVSGLARLRRCTLLLLAAALVAAVLVVHDASPASADYRESVWSATLTVREWSAKRGCDNGFGVPGVACSLTANLTEDGFTFDGESYEVTAIQWNIGSRWLDLRLNKTIPDSLKSALTLYIGGKAFRLADAVSQTTTNTNDNLKIEHVNAPWEPGDTVSLQLVKNAPGMLDTSFDTDGWTTTGFGTGSDDIAKAVVVGDGGKIVAAGYSDSSGSDDFALARYNADGSLDTSFGTGGKVTTDFGSGSDDKAWAVWTGARGKVVAAGTSGGDFALARYHADGSLDTSFGTGGKVTTDFGGGDLAYAMAVLPGGKIVVAGTGGGAIAVARYHADGSLDTSFGDGGKVTTTDFISGGSNREANAVAVLPGGKILVAGTIRFLSAPDVSEQNALALVRYNADGSLDESFGTGGKVTDAPGVDEASRFALDMAVQSDGKIVTIGFPAATLQRFNADGSLDESFGTGGRVYSVPFSGDTTPLAMSMRPSGKIVVAGYADNSGDYDLALARYNADGSLDESFGTGGKVTTDVGGTDQIDAMAVQLGGKIVVVGGSYTDDDDFVVARYHGDGPHIPPSSVFRMREGDPQQTVTVDLGGEALASSARVVLSWAGEDWWSDLSFVENLSLGDPLEVPRGARSFEFNVVPVDDRVPEGTETHAVKVMIDTNQDGAFDDITGTVDIVVEDNDDHVIEMTPSSAEVTEGEAVTVTLAFRDPGVIPAGGYRVIVDQADSAGMAEIWTIPIGADDGNSVNEMIPGWDFYMEPSRSVWVEDMSVRVAEFVFTPDEPTHTLRVTARRDSVDDDGETIRLRARHDSFPRGLLPLYGEVTLTIRDAAAADPDGGGTERPTVTLLPPGSPTAVTLTVSPNPAPEGAAVTLTATLDDGAPAQGVNVTFHAWGSGASPAIVDSDYTLPPSCCQSSTPTIEIVSGHRTATSTLNVLADGIDEGDETVFVEVYASIPGNTVWDSATLTIQDPSTPAVQGFSAGMGDQPSDTNMGDRWFGFGPVPERRDFEESEPCEGCGTGRDGVPLSDLQTRYAELIAQMYEWREDPQWRHYKVHTVRWDRALLAFGETVADTTLTKMTAAEAQGFADRGSAWSRWVEVAAALREIEGGQQEPPNPHAELIARMYGWREDPLWSRYTAHTVRWDRALLAFGETVTDTTLTKMTAAEAQAYADRGSAWVRWVEVAAALREIEGG